MIVLLVVSILDERESGEVGLLVVAKRLYGPRPQLLYLVLLNENS
jgi:hypothetical protein